MNKNFFEIALKVRDYECDIQGVVNNAVYQSYLEHARHEYLSSKNASFKKLNDVGTVLMVSRIEMDFKKPLISEDHFTVKLITERIGLKLVFFEDIYKVSDNSVCLNAKVEVVAKINGKINRGELFDFLNV